MLEAGLLDADGIGPDRLSLADEGVLARLEKDPVYHETLMRFVSLRLLDWGMRKKDVCFLTGVSEYFVDHTGVALERHRGAAAGPWTLCRHREARREAAMFLHEWRVAGQPFTQRPSALALAVTYCRYFTWQWYDDQRERIDPSAALAIIRNVGSGELILRQCLRCERLSLQPHKPDGGARGGRSCSFCNCAMTRPMALTADHRIPSIT